MKNLNYQLKQLCQRNHDGSYATRHNGERALTLIADQLHLLGYRTMSAQSLNPKNIDALVARWQADALAIGTIKNRMSALRWWAEKVNKRSVVAHSNDHYADRGDHLLLKASWTRGGKARMIPGRTPAQRELLTRAHQLAGCGLLPSSACPH